jgi:hypothetical protein
LKEVAGLYAIDHNQPVLVTTGAESVNKSDLPLVGFSLKAKVVLLSNCGKERRVGCGHEESCRYYLSWLVVVWSLIIWLADL